MDEIVDEIVPDRARPLFDTLYQNIGCEHYFFLDFLSLHELLLTQLGTPLLISESYVDWLESVDNDINKNQLEDRVNKEVLCRISRSDY